MPHLGPRTPLNMDYLHRLAERGLKVIDVLGIGLLSATSRIIVYCSDGSQHEFTFDCSNTDFMDHYREAMAFSGYCPRALGNFIHADVCRRMKADGLNYEDYRIGLSPQCREHIGSHLQHWTGYGYTFHDLPALDGVKFIVQIQPKGCSEFTDRQ